VTTLRCRRGLELRRAGFLLLVCASISLIPIPLWGRRDAPQDIRGTWNGTRHVTDPVTKEEPFDVVVSGPRDALSCSFESGAENVTCEVKQDEGNIEIDADFSSSKVSLVGTLKDCVTISATWKEVSNGSEKDEDVEMRREACPTPGAASSTPLDKGSNSFGRVREGSQEHKPQDGTRSSLAGGCWHATAVREHQAAARQEACYFAAGGFRS